MATNTAERATLIGKTQLVLVQHEGIPTRDAERSRDFYTRILGLEVLPRPNFPSPGYWIGIPGRFPQIHIIQSTLPTPGPDAPINARSRHTCFEVTDCGALKALLEREGIPYQENAQSPVGRAQLFCTDPDGHTLEFQQAQ